MSDHTKILPDRHADLMSGLVTSIAEQSAERFAARVSNLPSATGSPIEQLMGTALFYAVSSTRHYAGESWGAFGESWPLLNLWTVLEDADIGCAPPRWGLFVWHQQPVGKYRADFVLCLGHYHGGFAWGAIECDGHDYHNLTKEQAQHDRERDRYFQSRGLIVLRYTGSEIWKDPLRCAVDAVEILYARAHQNRKDDL